MGDEDSSGGFTNLFRFHYRGMLVFFIPIILCPLIISWPEKEGRALYIFLIIVCYNVTQALPLWVVGWVGPVLLPCVGLLASEDVSKFYFAEPVSYMFGCYMVAIAFEVSGLTKRMAYCLLSCSGFSLTLLHLYLTLLTFVISSGFSNTATVAMMSPVVRTMLEEIETEKIVSTQEEPDPEQGGKKRLTAVGKAFYIAIAYSATIGGGSEIEGTSATYALQDYFRTNFTLPGNKEELGNEYCAYALLPSLVILLLTYVVLEVLYFGMLRSDSSISQEITQSAGNRENAKRNITVKRDEMGGWNFHQILVLILFIILMLLTTIRDPTLTEAMPRTPITITSFLYIIVLLLFIIPSNTSCFSHFTGNGPFPENSIKPLLPWPPVHKGFPWGLFFMLGCYLAAVEAINLNGLSVALEEKLNFTEDTDVDSVRMKLILITILCTAVVPNVAAAHLLLPAAGRIAINCKIHPLYLLVPTGMACNLSFILPCGSPGNSVVAEHANIGSFFFIMSGIIPTIISFLILWFSKSLFTIVFPDGVDFPEE